MRALRTEEGASFLVKLQEEDLQVTKNELLVFNILLKILSYFFWHFKL